VSLQLPPEFFALLGVNVFLAISLLTCLLDRYFPGTLPYMYQLAALTGFGQLLVSKEFLPNFGDYMRFWYCFVYFFVAISNVIALNAYLAFFRRLQLISKAFLGSVTVPALLASVFFVYNYVSLSSHPILVLPALTLENVFFIILAFDTMVLGVSIYVFFKPKWVDIAVTGMAVLIAVSLYALLVPAWRHMTFIVSAVILGVAVFMVLGASIYVLLRLVWETLQTKTKKGGEKT
jgi:hypothetical protein